MELWLQELPLFKSKLTTLTDKNHDTMLTSFFVRYKLNKFLYSPDTPAASKGCDEEAVGLLSEYAYLEAIAKPKTSGYVTHAFFFVCFVFTNKMIISCFLFVSQVSSHEQGYCS